MAIHESYSDIPEQPDFERLVLRYFLKEQRSNPEFMKGLADRLWDTLSTAERDTISITQATFFPDDIEARQKSRDAQLVVDYLRAEAANVRELEAIFDIAPEPRHPEDD